MWDEVWQSDFIPKAKVTLNGCQRQKRLNAASLLSLQRCFEKNSPFYSSSLMYWHTYMDKKATHNLLMLASGYFPSALYFVSSVTVGFKHSSVAPSINRRFYKACFSDSLRTHNTSHSLRGQQVSRFALLCVWWVVRPVWDGFSWLTLFHRLSDVGSEEQEKLWGHYDSPDSLHGSRFSSKPTHHRLK